MEGVVGFVWRYGNNDYGIAITNFDKKDEKILMDIYTKYTEANVFSGCRENAHNCNVENANIAYWEKEWSAKEIAQKRRELAEKIYQVGVVETDVLYDHNEDTHLTVEDLDDELKTYKGAAYRLESIMQFCDGGQESEDHDKFFALSMDIIHYMEGLKDE